MDLGLNAYVTPGGFELDVLARSPERDLIERAKAGDRHARDRLVAAHLRLVASIARRSSLRGTSLEDAIHEGVLGLIEALDRFDVERDNRFSTYASYWIRDRIANHTRANRQMVRAPSTRNARTVLRGYGRAHKALESELGRSPSRSEIASRLHVSEDDVAGCEPSLGHADVALDGFEPSDIRSHVRWNGDSPEDAFAEAEARCVERERVSRALDALGSRERWIVERRFLDEDATSLAELGASLGISRERARQLQEVARAKLRRLLAA